MIVNVPASFTSLSSCHFLPSATCLLTLAATISPSSAINKHKVHLDLLHPAVCDGFVERKQPPAWELLRLRNTRIPDFPQNAAHFVETFSSSELRLTETDRIQTVCKPMQYQLNTHKEFLALNLVHPSCLLYPRLEHNSQNAIAVYRITWDYWLRP